MFITIGGGRESQNADGENAEAGPEGGPGGGPEGGPGGGPAGGPESDSDSQDENSEQRDRDPESVYKSTKDIAEKKSVIGVNLDLSISTDKDEETSFEDLGSLVSSAVKGYDENDIVAALRCFPAQVVSEDDNSETGGLLNLTRTADELKKGELKAFRSGIDAGAGMIIVGNVIVDDVDSKKPATLSSKVVPKLLRKELGYEGVAITDGMDIDDLTDQYSYTDIIEGVFKADIDMVLNPDNLTEYVTAAENALDNGDIEEDQLDTKVRRVLALKYEKGLLSEEEDESDNE